MAKKQERVDYDVTPAQFIEAWETSETVEEVAKKLGMPKPIVHARASTYRKAGVKLKKLKRSSNGGLDVEALNALIESLTPPEKKESQSQSKSERIEGIISKMKKPPK